MRFNWRMAAKASGGKRRGGAAQRRKAAAWHLPSFLVGAVLGLAGGLAATQAPSYLTEQMDNLPAAMPLLSSGESEELTFRFDDLLKNSEVPANPERYGPGAPAPSPAEAEAQAPDEPRALPAQAFHIQAASFRREEDAEQLRARLMLQALPAVTARVEIDSGAWHRVTVGPIESAEEAKRIMNLLREQDLSAMWIKRS